MQNNYKINKTTGVLVIVKYENEQARTKAKTLTELNEFPVAISAISVGHSKTWHLFSCILLTIIPFNISFRPFIAFVGHLDLRVLAVLSQ